MKSRRYVRHALGSAAARGAYRWPCAPVLGTARRRDRASHRPAAGL